MKKNFLTLVILVSTIISVMVLSSFVVPKQEYSQTEVSASDNWKLFREQVPYCYEDKDACAGYGFVWVNTETYQIAFSIRRDGIKYDLSEYADKKGYNMRFWFNSQYYYVNIFIPKSAFE